MGYYIDQLAEQDRQKRLADLLAMQQDNTDPGVQFDTGPQNIASITRGRSEEEINQILSGMRISTPGFNAATFNSDGSNPQPAQVQPPQLPRNYVQMGNNAPIDMDQRQPMPQNYFQRGNNAPVDLGQSARVHDVYRDGPQTLRREQLPDGRTLVTQKVAAMDSDGRQGTGVRQIIETPDYLNPAKLAEMKYREAQQKLSGSDVENQLKKAQLMELMGQDPSQMMPQGMPATGGQAPRVAAPVIQQGQPASSSGDADPMLLALRQKFLQRRFGNPPPGERWDEQGRAIPIPGHQKDLGEGQKKQVLGVQNLSGAIDEYRAELAGWSGVDALSPDKRAGMGVKYNNMMLQAKEAYNLGVLNGPDFAILTSVITDPRSLTGAITSNEAMDKQASELKRIMQKVGANVSNSRPSVPSQDAPQKAKTVVRTGTANGRKVVQYSDGSVDYAP